MHTAARLSEGDNSSFSSSQLFSQLCLEWSLDDGRKTRHGYSSLYYGRTICLFVEKLKASFFGVDSKLYGSCFFSSTGSNSLQSSWANVVRPQNQQTGKLKICSLCLYGRIRNLSHMKLPKYGFKTSFSAVNLLSLRTFDDCRRHMRRFEVK